MHELTFNYFWKGNRKVGVTYVCISPFQWHLQRVTLWIYEGVTDSLHTPVGVPGFLLSCRRRNRRLLAANFLCLHKCSVQTLTIVGSGMVITAPSKASDKFVECPSLLSAIVTKTTVQRQHGQAGAYFILHLTVHHQGNWGQGLKTRTWLQKIMKCPREVLLTDWL